MTAADLSRRGLALGFDVLCASGLARRTSAPVAYVVERADWSIRWDAHYLARAIEARHPGTVAVTRRPFGHRGRVVHFGSQFLWQAWDPVLPAANRYVVTYYHGKREDGPAMTRHVDYLLGHLGRLACIVTAAGRIEARLLAWGVPAAMVRRVVLGVDVELFRPPDADQRRAARRALGVPEGAICVGSFQKDGVGWGRGLEPKLVKGPDVLVDAVARLGRDVPVFVLLTGPARGYVRRELTRRNIPYTHRLLRHFPDIVACYHALDFYLVASREEGGPKAILESMATGVPVVSTRVGMAEDLIEDGVNGFLVDVDNAEALAARAAELATNPSRAAGMRTPARRTAEAHDWSVSGEALFERVYRELIA